MVSACRQALTSNGRIQPGQKDENPIDDFDYLVIKFSATGNIQWNNTIGGTGKELASSIRQTADGGYIVAGTSASGIGADKTEAPKLGTDLWIVKLDANGVVSWDKTIGGPYVQSIMQSADGGYLAGGYTNTNAGGDKSENSKGGYDMWIVKLDPAGSVVWDRTLGGSANDYLYSFLENPDGSLILGGESGSGIGGDKTEASRGSSDIWVVRLSGSGNKIWDKTIGGSSYETGNRNCLTKTSDGEFLIGCTSGSGISGDKTETSRGSNDFWVVKFAPENAFAPQATLRINAGGPDFTTATKKLFIADKYYDGIDRTSSIASGDILNTTNDMLYRSGRCSPSFSYNIPVVSGQINVTLHFAETYFGVPGRKGGAGSRQFHVNIEGSRKLTNYDIFAAAGGALRANQITIPVTVTDGMLNIDFLTGAADLPRVSAIEVVAASVTLSSVEDAFVRGGSYRGIRYGLGTNLDIKHVINDASASRSSYLKFQLPALASVTSAKLRIYGHNHENAKNIYVHAYGVDNDSWSESEITQSNAPAASTTSLGYVAVNAVYQYYEIDVTSYIKTQQQTGGGLVSLLINDPNNRNTRLMFNSKEAGVNPPQLVIQTTAATSSVARLGQETFLPEVNENQSSTVYPNPARNKFAVSLSAQHAGPVTFELINAAGKGQPVQALENGKAGEKAEISIANQSLHSGIYLLKIQSNAFTEVVKMLIAE